MNWDLVWTSDNLTRLLVGDLGRGDPGGLLLTLMLSAVTIIGSTILGALIGVMRASRRSIVSFVAGLYVGSFRNVPLLILIFWAYLVPPRFGWEISKFASVSIALVLFTAAYIAEIVRGGIRSIPFGNYEAARALGLSSTQIVIWIVLPQAFYRMIPALTGRYITAVKNTSLAFLIGMSDLTEIGRDINTRLFTAPIEVYFILLVIYFAVNRCLSFAMRTLENHRRFNRVFVRI